jgi:hypothetical protein
MDMRVQPHAFEISAIEDMILGLSSGRFHTLVSKRYLPGVKLCTVTHL